MPVPWETAQKTQDIITILIRYSKISYDIVTIAIRQDKIDLVFPNVTGCTWLSGVLDRPLRSVLIDYERIRLPSDSDMTFQIVEDSNPTFSLSCLSADWCRTGVIIGTIWTLNYGGAPICRWCLTILSIPFPERSNQWWTYTTAFRQW